MNSHKKNLKALIYRAFFNFMKEKNNITYGFIEKRVNQLPPNSEGSI